MSLAQEPVNRAERRHGVDRVWLDRYEVCQATGLGLSSVDQLIHSGQLRSFKVGRRRFIPAEAVDELTERLLSQEG